MACRRHDNKIIFYILPSFILCFVSQSTQIWNKEPVFSDMKMSFIRLFAKECYFIGKRIIDFFVESGVFEFLQEI